MKVKVRVYTITDLMENEVVEVVGSHKEAEQWVLDNRGEVYKFKGDAEVSIEGFEVETEVLQ